MISNEKIYTSTLISSLNKTYNQSKLDGKLHVEDIYLLNSIYKLLNGCEMSLSNEQKKLLNSLYSNIINSSKYLCTSKIYNKYVFHNTAPFIQAESTDCNTLPVQDLIYYWQEPLGIIDIIIIENIAEGDYLETKASDLKSKFIEGKNIEYTDIGLICFALNKVLIADNYHIYDDDNNADITAGFESFYNTDLKTRIFISYNIYSHGIMNFKIKKI